MRKINPGDVLWVAPTDKYPYRYYGNANPNVFLLLLALETGVDGDGNPDETSSGIKVLVILAPDYEQQQGFPGSYVERGAKVTYYPDELLQKHLYFKTQINPPLCEKYLEAMRDLLECNERKIQDLMLQQTRLTNCMASADGTQSEPGTRNLTLGEL